MKKWREEQGYGFYFLLGFFRLEPRNKSHDALLRRLISQHYRRSLSCYSFVKVKEIKECWLNASLYTCEAHELLNPSDHWITYISFFPDKPGKTDGPCPSFSFFIKRFAVSERLLPLRKYVYVFQWSV